MSEQSLHDNNVYAYSILCDQRRIVLYTEYEGGAAEEYTDVIFLGVVAHHFNDVLSGNILFGIEEVDVAYLVSNWSDLFAQRKNWGWPDGIEYKDADELTNIFSKRGIKGFEISSSYGLSGWVLAEAMAVRRRDRRAEGVAE